MSPTNEQITAEARRRLRGESMGTTLADKIIEVMREGWKPPEPVDPDLMAWREWGARTYPSEAKNISAGRWDNLREGLAYLAGARMAREQERERARKLAEFVEDQSRRLDGVGARAHDILSKYRGEA